MAAEVAWKECAELVYAASGFVEEEKSGSSPNKANAGESWESIFAGATGLEVRGSYPVPFPVPLMQFKILQK